MSDLQIIDPHSLIPDDIRVQHQQFGFIDPTDSGWKQRRTVYTGAIPASLGVFDGDASASFDFESHFWASLARRNSLASFQSTILYRTSSGRQWLMLR
jgi:hypothetical protein